MKKLLLFSLIAFSAASSLCAKNAIVLTHGAFAASNTWMLPGSTFYSNVEQATNGNADIYPYYWEQPFGGLFDIEKINAAKELATLVIMLKASGYDKISIIAHSYGGHVAAIASQLLNESKTSIETTECKREIDSRDITDAFNKFNNNIKNFRQAFYIAHQQIEQTASLLKSLHLLPTATREPELETEPVEQPAPEITQELATPTIQAITQTETLEQEVPGIEEVAIAQELQILEAAVAPVEPEAPTTQETISTVNEEIQSIEQELAEALPAQQASIEEEISLVQTQIAQEVVQETAPTETQVIEEVQIPETNEIANQDAATTEIINIITEIQTTSDIHDNQPATHDYYIDIVYTLVTPTEEIEFPMDMDTVHYVINGWSAGDPLQELLGGQKIDINPNRAVNLEFLIPENEQDNDWWLTLLMDFMNWLLGYQTTSPNHMEMRSSIIGRWLPQIPFELQALGINGFENFTFEKDGILTFDQDPEKPPFYAIN
ncbi:hypothetical protein K2W90_06310 [Candidatus Babeliales bacterium]|nr:hypothetical protein [Candidatus Babeliales bacterium]